MAAWTYTASPFEYPGTAQTKLDSVRFLVGDTDSSDPQLMDGEVNGLILQNSSDPTGAVQTGQDLYQAAIAACGALSARYARKATKSTGDLTISYSGISKTYADLAKTLTAQALRHASITPYAGGISLGDMETDTEDDDLNQPQFSVGMDDNPDTAVSITGGASGFSQAVPAG